MPRYYASHDAFGRDVDRSGERDPPSIEFSAEPVLGRADRRVRRSFKVWPGKALYAPRREGLAGEERSEEKGPALTRLRSQISQDGVAGPQHGEQRCSRPSICGPLGPLRRVQRVERTTEQYSMGPVALAPSHDRQVSADVANDCTGDRSGVDAHAQMKAAK